VNHWFQREKHPPTLIPFCRLCEMPVARLMYRVPREDAWVVDFEAQCCGKTQGAKVTLAELYRLQQTNEKFYLIVRKGHHQQIAAQAKRRRRNGS
jgi:hypothetical protein